MKRLILVLVLTLFPMTVVAQTADPVTVRIVVSVVGAESPAPLPVLAPPVPLPSTELMQVLTAQAINHASEMAELQELRTQLTLVRQDIAEFRAAVKSKWSAVVNSPVFKYGLAALTGFLATHKWGG